MKDAAMRLDIRVTSGACVCLPTALRTVIGLGEWEWVRLCPDGEGALRLGRWMPTRPSPGAGRERSISTRRAVARRGSRRAIPS